VRHHCLIAIGRAAVEAGHRVRYYTAIELVEQLWRGQADSTVGKTIEQVCRNDLIVIDEIGFASLEPVLCQLLFRFISAAYEKRSVAIASHTPFEDWGRFLTDQPTSGANLDRLCHDYGRASRWPLAARSRYQLPNGCVGSCRPELVLDSRIALEPGIGHQSVSQVKDIGHAVGEDPAGAFGTGDLEHHSVLVVRQNIVHFDVKRPASHLTQLLDNGSDRGSASYVGIRTVKHSIVREGGHEAVDVSFVERGIGAA
jgi:hypothetical protein